MPRFSAFIVFMRSKVGIQKIGVLKHGRWSSQVLHRQARRLVYKVFTYFKREADAGMPVLDVGKAQDGCTEVHVTRNPPSSMLRLCSALWLTHFPVFRSLLMWHAVLAGAVFKWDVLYTGQFKKKVTLSRVYNEETSEPTITRFATIVWKTLKICL
jgi:hypothetical protein